ncbi:dynamin-binding protein-like isoform X3 [Apostichopus japonicus]|uniref:dynamin-binding protein-like isoform X3 n=1 Tax=Stichopus japonicus TaxID=307972 RepID=UPI003AB2C899
MDPGAVVKALFDFETTDESELPLCAGDVITVTEQVDANWLKGTCNGQTGSFPSNFVALYQSTSSSTPKVKAQESFVGSHEGDLSFEAGDEIEVLHSVDENWLYGKCKGLSGIFPASCVPGQLPSEASKPGSFIVKALKDNNGQLEGELTFQKGDLISVTEKIDEDWWKGDLNGETGILPSVCVEICNNNGTSSQTQEVDGKRCKPWAKALFPFSAESEGELSFMDNEEIVLLRRVNDSWLEGEVEGKKGIFPANFVQVMEDIPIQELISATQEPPEPVIVKETSSTTPEQMPLSNTPAATEETPASDTTQADQTRQLKLPLTDSTIWKGKRGKVLFDFKAENKEDLEVKQGDIITVVTRSDQEWFEAKHPDGRQGFIPVNYLQILGKPKSPSSKRKAPAPPPSNGHEQTLFSSDDFDSLAEITSKSKPALPPKPKSLSSPPPSKQLDDLLCFDPIFDAVPAIEPLKPQAVLPSEKPPVPAKPEALSPTQPPSVPLSSSDDTGLDAPSIPQSSKYNILTSAQPFSPSFGARPIRSIQSPVSPTHGKAAGLLTLDDISKDFDKALDGSLMLDDTNSPLPPPTIPVRQASPNPFNDKEEGEPATAAVASNPFSAVESTLDSLLAKPPDLEEPIEPNDEPPAGLPRDDSVTSDLSDDTFFQNISVTINPSPVQLSPHSSEAFKIPPPPSKGTVIGKPPISAKPEKLYSKSAVPRPRGRLSTGDSIASNGLPASAVPVSDVAAFEASVENIFSSRDLDHTPGTRQEVIMPSLLEQDLGVIGQAVSGSVGSSSVDDAIGDLLGVEGMAPERPPPKKKPPPRPSPPKVAPVANVSREDQILAHLHPDSGTDVVTEEPGVELQDTLSSLQASIAEYKLEIQRGKDQKGKLEELSSSAATDEDKLEIEQQLSDMTGNLEHLEQELSSLQAQLNELQPDQLQLLTKKNAEFRNKVVKEILKTETIYVRDIKLCQKGFMTVLEEKQDEISNILKGEEDVESTDKRMAKGLELDVLFGNMDEVIMVAENFMNAIATTVEEKSPEEQFIGECFMEHSSDLHSAYATYCRNHDDAIALLEKYEENPEVQEYINQGLELVRQSTNCWDLASFLIKPVQRILKYHLLLAELYKYTEEDLPDRPNIQRALTAMTDVANSINEFKRRKDLVMKYRKPGQEAISDKIGKINMHSIKKKSQRMNQKITRITGLASQTVDEDFDKMERRFRVIEKTIKIFVTDINSYLEQLKTATSAEATVGSDISDYYASQSNLHEVNKYEAAQRHLANKLYKDYTLFVQQRVLSPLESLLNMFQGPHKLIQKRHHKLLDYDSCMNKVEKTKDKEKSKQVRDEKEVARKNFEAMNIQLKDEIPKLCEMSLAIFKSCVVSFVEAERDHINSTLKKIYPLLELSIVHNSDLTDILAAFEASHLSAVEHQYQFTFVPNNFDKKDKLDRRLSRRSTQPAPPPSKPQPNKNNNQSENHRGRLTKRYPADRLVRASCEFIAKEPMELSVNKGDLVAIIKQQDPSGGGDRWYVDNGVSQGFVPSSVLSRQEEAAVAAGGVDQCDGSDEEQPLYFYAEWSFTASAPNEISLDAGMVVRLVSAQDVDGNSEWWLVDQEGRQGYVPGNYLAKIP